MALTVLIDGDGCPVVNEAVALAREFHVNCVIFCDTAHQMERPGAETVTVSKGADSADFALVNRVKTGDIVITQDYGLAAMCLSKSAIILNQDGKRYTSENIDALLFSRYVGKKVRKAGGRLKGPSKRRPEQTAHFIQTLRAILEEHT